MLVWKSFFGTMWKGLDCFIPYDTNDMKERYKEDKEFAFGHKRKMSTSNSYSCFQKITSPRHIYYSYYLFIFMRLLTVIMNRSLTLFFLPLGLYSSCWVAMSTINLIFLFASTYSILFCNIFNDVFRFYVHLHKSCTQN